MTVENYVASWETEETQAFRKVVRRFVETEFVPEQNGWRQRGQPTREAWRKAGGVGLLLSDVPATYGGCGGTFAHEIVVCEELARAGVHFGSSVQGIVARYLACYGTEEQKTRWLPSLANGEMVAAIAMTEPGSGSDLQSLRTRARQDGDDYVLDGSKTFVTNGCCADLICVAARTSSTDSPMKSLSMIILEVDGAKGYEAGKPLEKLGMHEQDVCELFFEGVRVPRQNLIGRREGMGFLQMMEQLPFERLAIAAKAIASAERALSLTIPFCQQRMVFGKSLLDFQNTRFKLAECRTASHIAKVFLDTCVHAAVQGKIDETQTAMVKMHATELESQVVDTCLQLHGGYGYMLEYPISRLWADARVQRIYGGTNEVMREIVASSL